MQVKYFRDLKNGHYGLHRVIYPQQETGQKANIQVFMYFIRPVIIQVWHFKLLQYKFRLLQNPWYHSIPKWFC